MLTALRSYSPCPLVNYAWRWFLCDADADRLNWPQRAALYLLPVAVGFAVEVSAPAPEVGAASGLALAALLLLVGLLVFAALLPARLGIDVSERLRPRTRVRKLTAATAAGALYVAFTALLLAAAAATAGLLQGVTSHAAAGIGAALALHALFCTVILLRRCLGLLIDLFDDFQAEPHPNP